MTPRKKYAVTLGTLFPKSHENEYWVMGMNFDAYLAPFLLEQICDDADMQTCPEDMSLSFAIFAFQMVLLLRHYEFNGSAICYTAGLLYSSCIYLFLSYIFSYYPIFFFLKQVWKQSKGFLGGRGRAFQQHSNAHIFSFICNEAHMWSSRCICTPPGNRKLWNINITLNVGSANKISKLYNI